MFDKGNNPPRKRGKGDENQNGDQAKVRITKAQKTHGRKGIKKKRTPTNQV